MSTSDRDLIDRVTAKLAGEFYVGQAVHISKKGGAWAGKHGVITDVQSPAMPFHIGVAFGEASDGETLYFFPHLVWPDD